MIIVSHESINGNFRKLKEMFKNNSHILSEEERLKYVDTYCSKELKMVISG